MSHVEPVKKSILVNAPQERAFRVFTEGVDRWWPRQHHIGKSPLKRAVIEARAGGRWYAVCEDGTECDTGRVLAWDPPRRVLLSWQITSAWQFDPTFSTEVEVTFRAEGPNRTLVELEHRDLHRFGAAAEGIRKQIDADGGWRLIVERFAHTAEEQSTGESVMSKKWVLMYETAEGGLVKARELFPAHKARLDVFHARGTLLMVGTLGSPPTGALAVFTTREAADEFVREDPFVVEGAVKSPVTIQEWNEVYT